MKMVFTYDMEDIITLICIIIVALFFLWLFVVIKIEAAKNKFKRWKQRRKDAKSGGKTNEEEGKDGSK